MNLNDTVYEEAKRCPKCEVPGKKVRDIKAPNGNGRIHFFQCENEACKWYQDGTYMVQVDRTGAIPVRNPKQDKDFPVLPSSFLNKASSLVDEVNNPDTDGEGRPEIKAPWTP